MSVLDQARRMLKTTGIISGLANCHVLGLYSYVLKPRESDTDGMWRIFFAPKSCESLNGLWKEDGSDFRLLPHNHRQDISLHGLFGSAVNVSIRKMFSGLPGRGILHRYGFGSALLDGSFSLHPCGSIWLPDLNDRSVICASGVHLHWSDTHTVIADSASAWLVIEGAIAPAGSKSFCYSRREDLRLSGDGLYVPIPANELASHTKALLEMWS